MRGSPQPALLYLLPSILFPVALVGYFRSEFSSLWAGPETEEILAAMSEGKIDRIEQELEVIQPTMV